MVIHKPKPNQSKVYYTWKQFDNDVNKIIKYIKCNKLTIKGIYGIPKGGLPLAVTLANRLNVPFYQIFPSPIGIPNKQYLVVDDISDEGDTLLGLRDINTYTTITLFIKPRTKFIPNFVCRHCKNTDWICYPWE